MTYQKFTLGDSLTKGFGEKIKAGKIGSNIDKRIKNDYEQKLEKFGFAKDGLSLQEITE